jgi:hypothetical protein
MPEVPAYLRGRDRRIMAQGSPRQKYKTPYEKQTIKPKIKK